VELQKREGNFSVTVTERRTKFARRWTGLTGVLKDSESKGIGRWFLNQKKSSLARETNFPKRGARGDFVEETRNQV